MSETHRTDRNGQPQTVGGSHALGVASRGIRTPRHLANFALAHCLDTLQGNIGVREANTTLRGIAETAVDQMGNLTIGIKENTIFPETSDEDLKDVFGLAVTIVTTAKTKKEALAFFRYLGIPFKK